MAGSILVTGANGNIGSLLVPVLTGSMNLPVRVLVRDSAKGEPLAAAGADVRLGGFDDPASLAASMQGVDIVVLIAPPGPDCVSHNRAVIRAAADSGVRKIVRVSAIKAAEDGRTENTRLHGACDRLLMESGLTYVILRPNYFMQNIFMSLDSITQQNGFAAGMGDGRFAMIDVRDVADATAAAVRSDQFDNQVFELSGPESISFNDVARALSMVADRTIAYIPVSPEDVRATLLEMGMGEWMANLLMEYSQAYGDGWGDLVTDSVQQLTGHPPRSFQTFTAELLDAVLR